MVATGTTKAIFIIYTDLLILLSFFLYGFITLASNNKYLNVCLLISLGKTILYVDLNFSVIMKTCLLFPRKNVIIRFVYELIDRFKICKYFRYDKTIVITTYP